jgi:carboxypeptidase Q
MKRRVLWLASALALALVAVLAAPVVRAGGEIINYSDLNKIKAEGLQRSQVMELCSWLADVYTPRVTGSPTALKAAEWTVAKMKEWGLQNVAIEPWVNRNGFERGWTNDKFYMQVTAPERFPVPGTPTAWTPGTNGLVSGEAVLVTATTEEDLAQYKGKLRGKWVLLVAAPDVAAFWDARAKRYKTDDLDTLELQPAAPALEFGVTPPGQRGAAPAAPQAAQGQRAGAPAAAPAAAAAAAGQGQRAAAPPAQAQGQRAAAPPAAAAQGGQRAAGQAPAAAAGQPPQFGGGANARSAFLRAEGALGTITTTATGHGIYTIGGNRSADPATTLPAISIAAEHYGRIARTLAKKIPVTIEADIRNTYYPNPAVFNVVGEITGSDKADEVVLLGAHIDTWHAATGAADDGVGVAAMMEALRILKTTGVPLRRTVRVGFWEGEEQGLLGSREYVAAHYATRQAAQGAQAAPAGGQRGGPQGPLVTKPEYDKFCVYFNIDNGTGALRGIYLQGNDAVAPIFREWMEPFRALGMTTITVRNTGGTDHQSFDGVGLPGFQFIQDEIEYNGVTHHTNMDTYERLQPNDVVKMSTIVAGWAYLAANREEKLPRKPANVPGQGGRRGQ